MVRLDPDVDRAQVMRDLEARGVPTRAYFRPIHLQPCYLERFGTRHGAFPVAERIGKTALALPLSGVMTEDEVDRVCAELRAVIETSPVRGSR